MAIATGIVGVYAAESVLVPAGDIQTGLDLVADGAAAYSVIYENSQDASAAADLASELGKAAGNGVSFQVIDVSGLSAEAMPARYISVGLTGSAVERGIGASFKPEMSMAEIKVIDGNIYLAGAMSSEEATMAFLEGDCGIRYFTDEITIYPKHDDTSIWHVTVTDRIEISPFVDRISHSACNQPVWSHHNRIQPGTGPQGWDAFRHPKPWFCHTYFSITPPSDYAAHPDYFTTEYTRPNRRHANMLGMLCPTHPENIRRACEKIDQAMTDFPDRKYFSISEPDCGIATNDIGGYWSFYCRCPRCQALIDKYGASVAPHLELVNSVAKYVKDKHPGQLVEFILYSFQKPPVGYPKMEENTSIFMCIEHNMFDPLDEEHGAKRAAQLSIPQNPDYAAMLKTWTDIVPHRTVWEYGVDYGNWFRIVPTMPFLADNLTFYKANGIEGVLNCEIMDTPGPGQRIRTWLLAKLLWNPSLDLESLASEYIRGVYGPAADAYQTYWNMLEEAGRAGFSVEDYYGRNEFLQKALACFDQAFNAAADCPSALYELEMDYLSLLVMQLDDLYNGYPANKDVFPQERYNALYDQAADIIKRHRMMVCHEMIPIENYLEERAYLVRRTGNESMESFSFHLGHGRIWNYRMAEDQPDADVQKVAAPINNNDWECQWVLPVHLLVPGRQYRFRAEIKLGQEAAPDAIVLQGGVYKDRPSNKDNIAASLEDKYIHTQFKPIKAGALSTSEFRWMDLETDVPFTAPAPGDFNEVYFYVSVPSNVEMWRMLVNRVEIIPIQ